MENIIKVKKSHAGLRVVTIYYYIAYVKYLIHVRNYSMPIIIFYEKHFELFDLYRLECSNTLKYVLLPN